MSYSYCPVCGTAYTATAQQEPFSYHCESCDYTYYEALRTTATALIIRDGKALLVKRGINPEKDTWDLPGGFVRPDEHPEQAVIRELQEELGVNIRIQSLYFVNSPGEYVYKNIMSYTCDHLYLCTLESEELAANDDVAEFRWFSRDELPPNEQVFSPEHPVFNQLRKDDEVWQV